MSKPNDFNFLTSRVKDAREIVRKSDAIDRFNMIKARDLGRKERKAARLQKFNEGKA